MKLNLRTKLIGSFVVILFLMVVVGLMGTHTSKTIRDRLGNIIEQNLKPANILGDVARMAGFVRSNSLLHLLTGSIDDMNRYESEVADWVGKINTDLDTLKNIFKDQATLDKLAEFRTAWETYLRVWREQVVPLSRANRNEKVFTLARKSGAGGMAAQEAMYKLGELHDANVAAANHGLKLADRDSRKSQYILSAVILLAIILGLAFGIRQGSLIASSVNTVSKAAQLVAAGDLDQRVMVKTGDEIESMANSFNTMTVKLKTMVEELQREIIKRRRAEDRQRKSKQWLSTTLRSIGDAVIATDAEGLVTLMNPVAEDLTGWDEPETAGKPLKDIFNIINDQTGERAESPVAKVLQEGVVVGLADHTVLIAKDGTKRHIADSESPIRDEEGKIIGTVLVFRDITERKQAEEELRKYRDHLEELVEDRTEALRKSEEKYKMMFEAAKDAVFLNDESGKFVDVNQVACKSLGYSKEELLKLSIKEIDADPGGYEAFLKIRNGPEERITFEVNQRRKDGTLLPVEISGNFFTIGGQRIALAIARDITDRKKLEAQFLQSQKMEAIGRLAGGVAHDFNNLLTSILGYGELALKDLKKDVFLRDYIEEIIKAGRSASALTRQLLAFSRKQAISPEILNLNDIITGMKKMVTRLIGEDIELETILSSDLFRIKMDSGQIEQIIMNLLVNAKDAMPKGGKISIETSNMQLDERYKLSHDVEIKPGSYVLLAISDTGFGMDSETRSRIFDPFFTTKEKGKGTGLGLSTVYGIVKQNNSFIWIYSEPEKGTTFKIYFPISEEIAEPVKKIKHNTDDLKGSETILLVEDNDSVRALLKKVLLSFGYQIFDAQDGEEALSIFKQYKDQIHIVVTDVVMPNMGGSDLIKNIQSIKPDIKAIYMSGYTDNTIVHHGILEKGINFIEKPLSPEKVALKVREVLETE